MEQILKNALDCNRAARTSLYEKYGKNVYRIAEMLLSDKDAADVTAGVFTCIWEFLKLDHVETEQDFKMLAEEITIESVMGRVQSKNPKAYRTPKNRNFSLSGIDIVSGENAVDTVLKTLPPFHKLALVLKTVTCIDDETAAQLLKLDKKTYESALECEKANVEYILKAAKADGYDYDRFAGELASSVDTAVIPDDANGLVLTEIAKTTAESEEKKKKKLRRILYALGGTLICIAAIVLLAIGLGKKENTALQYATKPVIELDDNLTYFADIDIKNHGTVTVKLDQHNAPITTSNFVKLAQDGFYDGLTFHRIIDGFMMQGGDPEGNGFGGSDKAIFGEFSDNGYDNPLSHTRGAISMGREFKNNNSATSQFFIVQEDSTAIDGAYAVFGYVTEGMDIVDEICKNTPVTDDNGTVEAADQPIMNSVRIRME